MFKLTMHSKRYGELESKEYDTLKKAQLAGGKSLKSHFHHDCYIITEDGLEGYSRGEYGYDEKFVIRDFKSYATCCRKYIGGWELSPESFRWFVYHEYIVPAPHDIYFTCDAGMYELTQRFRNVGIAVHNGCSPPEFEDN